MSDDDRDIDVESDEGEEYTTRQSSGQRQSSGNHYYSQAEKRAHHNALERKRRDHIKDSFSSLRDTVPALNGEKASRAQILKRAAEYISHMRKKIPKRQKSIDKLKYQNSLLEAQINQLENNRAGPCTVNADNDEDEESDNESEIDSESNDEESNDEESGEDTSDEEVPVQNRRTLKSAHH